MKTDIQIAQENTMLPIGDIAKSISISEHDLIPYGKYKAKIDLRIMETLPEKNGKLILVTAINPTKAGEGKSTTTIGLTDALARMQCKVMAALREPSSGPVFGLKGGATGGGYAQVVPMDDINLHFTGDMHAITMANNLISAIIDNHIYQGNELQINPERIVWKRCVDLNDRALRQVEVAKGAKNGVPRADGFNITVASEIMAILCLSKDLQDFEAKVNQCIIGYNMDEKPVYVKDLNIGGALSLIMKEAIQPNLVQTLEHTPVLIHGGPFANIAHGCNSLIATKMALRLADYVVTEAGFGADLGAEKFLDIKCRLGELQPSAVVIVATIRALKMHGGASSDNLKVENIEALQRGIENLAKHIENISQFQLPYVIAINKFNDDTDAEIATLMKWCDANHHPVSFSEVWGKGGAGGLDLAEKVIALCEKKAIYQPIYDTNWSIKEKVNTIVTKIYGGKDVVFTPEAEETIALFEKQGWGNLPVCMAKTPNSLTDQAKVVGRPRDFTITVKELRISHGAGFIVVLCGSVMTMPGLPKVPAACNMRLDADGTIHGLF